LCPAVDVLELVDISLQNDKFDEIEPYQVMPLLELCVTTVNSNKEVDEDTLKKIQENFGGVGRSVTNWLVRKFSSDVSSQNKSQTTSTISTYGSYYTTWSTPSHKQSLSDIISRINDLIKEVSVANFKMYFVEALHKLLAIPEDRDILIQELKYPKLDNWEPSVVEAFTNRAIRSVESLATTEKKQLRVFRILKNLTAKNVKTMKLMLIDRLLTFSVGIDAEPSLENTVNHSKLWVNFFKFLEEMDINVDGKVDKDLQHPVILCKQVREVLLQLATSVINGHTKLSHLQLFLANKERVHELLSAYLQKSDVIKQLLSVQGG